MNGATRKLIVVSLFLIPLSLVLSGGTAVAASSVAHTTLTIHGKPGGVVAPGTVITISGKLNSGNALCRSGQTIQLIELGTLLPVATTVTDAKGNYSFTQTVSADSAFQTHFAGSVSGVHPNTQDTRPLHLDLQDPGGGERWCRGCRGLRVRRRRSPCPVLLLLAPVHLGDSGRPRESPKQADQIERMIRRPG